MRPAPLFALLVLASACAQFPELEGTVPPEAEAADYPALVPVETLLAGDIASPAARSARVEADVAARAAALRARADRLRQSGMDPAERERLNSALRGE